MNSTDWGLLIVGIVNALAAVTAYMRAEAAKTSAAAAHQRLNQLTIKNPPAGG